MLIATLGKTYCVGDKTLAFKCLFSLLKENHGNPLLERVCSRVKEPNFAKEVDLPVILVSIHEFLCSLGHEKNNFKGACEIVVREFVKVRG